jgi:hypothetical protein
MNYYIMLFQKMKKFVKASQEANLRGVDLDAVVKMMMELRALGFSGGDLEILSGGRWRASTIRGYTEGLGRRPV